MRIMILMLTVAFTALGQTKEPAKADQPAPKILSRETQLEIKAIALEEKNADDAVKRLAELLSAPINAERQALFARVCVEYGVEVKDCIIDGEKNTVSKRPAPEQPVNPSTPGPAAKPAAPGQ